MKVKMHEVLKDQHGTPYASGRSSKDAGFIPLCLWELASNALLAEDDIEYDDMATRVALERKIHDASEPVDLGEAEVDMIKGLIKKAYKLPWLVVGAMELLEE